MSRGSWSFSFGIESFHRELSWDKGRQEGIKELVEGTSYSRYVAEV